MKVKTYTIDEIFEKRLLFLIPFYIFTYEARFREIDEDVDKVAELTLEFTAVRARLEQLAEDGAIDEFYKRTLLDMSERVVINLAAGHKNIRKGVGSVMSGQILDYEAKRIKNEGRKEGRKEGREEGFLEAMISLVNDGILTIKDAAARSGITEAAFRQKMTAK